MPSPVLTTGAVLLGALTILAAADHADTPRCSVASFSHGRATGDAVLLGSGLPDTVEAGAGEIAPREGYEDGWRGAGPIRGQRIEVAQHAGADSAVLARAFERSGIDHVIVVPWSNDPSCQPIPWRQSAAWVQPGEPGVFTVRLRPESLWAEGVPTFDALMAAFEPYPHGDFLQRGFPGTDSLRTTNALAPAEYFELLRAIPDFDAMRDDPDAAWATITEWRAGHPELASRFPATRILHWIGISITSLKRRQVLRTIEPAIAGTWRFTVIVNDGPERTFYARTRRRPTTEWRILSSVARADPADPPAHPEGYHMIASGALTADSLLTGCALGERTMAREGYIAALEPGLAGNEQATEWPGLIDVRLLLAQFRDDPVLRSFQRDFGMQRMGAPRDEGRFAPARFSVNEGGVMRVEQTIELDNGNRIVVRGERVSTAVIACDG